MHEHAPQHKMANIHVYISYNHPYISIWQIAYTSIIPCLLFMLILSFSFVPCHAYIHNTTILNCVGFQRPLITQSPENIKVAAGQKAELKCEASGKPAPNFQWVKDGCDVAGSAGVTITTGNGHSTLTINNIQDSHAGQYMCRAFNFLDTGMTSAVLLLSLLLVS